MLSRGFIFTGNRAMVWQGILFTSVIVRVVGRMGLCVAVMSKLHHSGRMLISSRRKKKKAKKAWPSGIRAAGKWFSYLDSVLSSAGTPHQDEINNTLLTENLASKKSPHCVLSLLLQNNSNPEVKVPTVFSKNICMILYWGWRGVNVHSTWILCQFKVCWRTRAWI